MPEVNSAPIANNDAKAFILPSELRNALLSYLTSRPYAEVAQGVASLVNLTPASE